MGCGGDCRNGDDLRVACAVERQMALYPESSLQDIYKSFFQAEFGPEHMIADTASAGRYLDSELEEPDSTKILFEPIGVDSSYYRVHLRAVQDGFMSRNELFSAFVGSTRKVDGEEIEAWKQKWSHILDVIEDMNLGLGNFDIDRQRIDSILTIGQYAVHHSKYFGECYKPHYRIVRKDLLPDCAEQ